MKTPTPVLLHQLVEAAAVRDPAACALEYGAETLNYAELARAVASFAASATTLGIERGERIAVYLEKRFETMIALFGASAAGAVMVPVNPSLKPAQVGHILSDCTVRILVTSTERLRGLTQVLQACPEVATVVLVDGEGKDARNGAPKVFAWHELQSTPPMTVHRAIDTDMAAIFYTSGSTGRPKGVVVSHRNLVAGAQSVAGYLENRADDALLAALPLSFDAGFSQLTTAFVAGARVALLNYLLPQDVLQAIERHRITGLTAVPPLYIQLARLAWPVGAGASLRYFANTGGHMPGEVLALLRKRLPAAKPYLMYGLTEAFRSGRT